MLFDCDDKCDDKSETFQRVFQCMLLNKSDSDEYRYEYVLLAYCYNNGDALKNTFTNDVKLEEMARSERVCLAEEAGKIDRFIEMGKDLAEPIKESIRDKSLSNVAMKKYHTILMVCAFGKKSPSATLYCLMKRFLLFYRIMLSCYLKWQKMIVASW